MTTMASMRAEAEKWGATHLILRSMDDETVIELLVYANAEAAPLLDKHLRAFEAEWDASE